MIQDQENSIDDNIEAQRQQEIESAPTNSNEMREEIRENHSASPADSGGDLDADWQESETSGSESVFGHNPTPDQSDVEENAHAMGLDYQDNEPMDLLEKMEKRDANRYELDESSKTSSGTI